jgi:hypothetical protein
MSLVTELGAQGHPNTTLFDFLRLTKKVKIELYMLTVDLVQTIPSNLQVGTLQPLQEL